MEFMEALRIVYDLANGMEVHEGEDGATAEQARAQNTALNMVYDVISGPAILTPKT